MATWQERLTGVKENGSINGYCAYFCETRSLNAYGETSVTLEAPNGTVLECGSFTLPTLGDLDNAIGRPCSIFDLLTVENVIAEDVGAMHIDYPRATFQVASQFNMLEMAAPHLTPEHGVGIYEKDRTQGPSCAMAAGGGAIYRNYFAVEGLRNHKGQSRVEQINSLEYIAELAGGNYNERLWQFRNGYVFPTLSGTEIFKRELNTASSHYNVFKRALRVGVQFDTALTCSPSTRVNQVYCAALPLGYMENLTLRNACEPLARLILEATYEATLAAAVRCWQRTGCADVFLTFVGGGVFKNRDEWIVNAILNALRKYRKWPLKVRLVNFRALQPIGKAVLEQWK